jgi:hypothetical protein
MLSKPQLVICPVTSLRQNSAALASGAIIAPKAIVARVVPQRARLLSKALSSCLFSLVAPGAEITEIGAPQSSIKHQTILKYYNHMKDFRCLRWPPAREDKVRAFVRETMNTVMTGCCEGRPCRRSRRGGSMVNPNGRPWRPMPQRWLRMDGNRMQSL